METNHPFLCPLSPFCLCVSLGARLFVSAPMLTLRLIFRVFPPPFAQMAEVLSGEHSHKYSSAHVLDARFPYEFDGGHIRGATNVYTPDMLSRYLAESIHTSPDDPRPPVIIMHCEFSQVRGPKLYVHTVLHSISPALPPSGWLPLESSARLLPRFALFFA